MTKQQIISRKTTKALGLKRHFTGKPMLLEIPAGQETA
jgi:hypothetical protein